MPRMARRVFQKRDRTLPFCDRQTCQAQSGPRVEHVALWNPPRPQLIAQQYSRHNRRPGAHLLWKSPPDCPENAIRKRHSRVSLDDSELSVNWVLNIEFRTPAEDAPQHSCTQQACDESFLIRRRTNAQRYRNDITCHTRPHPPDCLNPQSWLSSWNRSLNQGAHFSQGISRSVKTIRRMVDSDSPSVINYYRTASEMRPEGSSKIHSLLTAAYIEDLMMSRWRSDPKNGRVTAAVPHYLVACIPTRWMCP